MCGPLKNKIKTIDTKYYMPIPRGQTVVDIFLKENVKSAVEFYKKYRHNIQKFYDEEEDLSNRFLKETKQEPLKNLAFALLKKNSFDDWLFDYCFGDVIE